MCHGKCSCCNKKVTLSAWNLSSSDMHFPENVVRYYDSFRIQMNIILSHFVILRNDYKLNIVTDYLTHLVVVLEEDRFP